jgi:hypothetical protein
MKVSGFTFIRNAIKYDYPILEAISSILPICDEMVVAVGNSDDETRALIAGIPSDKIRIIDTVWDESLREGGKVLAVETNKAMDAIAADSDWCFYIQGDEAIHEQYLPAIQEAMLRWKDDSKVDGLLFDYKHFYGSYDYIADSRVWYRKEIRIIRNNKTIRSYRDAQGFRKGSDKLHVKPINAAIYHYGWVKPPQFQQAKREYFHKLWHNDDWVDEHVAKVDEFDYSGIDSLELFTGTHPKVMQERINRTNWKFDTDPAQKNFRNLKGRLLYAIEKLSGWRIGEYKNYKTC